jgi:hypothetical protein
MTGNKKSPAIAGLFCFSSEWRLEIRCQTQVPEAAIIADW